MAGIAVISDAALDWIYQKLPGIPTKIWYTTGRFQQYAKICLTPMISHHFLLTWDAKLRIIIVTVYANCLVGLVILVNHTGFGSAFKCFCGNSVQGIER
jgi:hypothetical protein